MMRYYVSLKHKSRATLLHSRKSNDLRIFQLSGNTDASDHHFDANILGLQTGKFDDGSHRN